MKPPVAVSQLMYGIMSHPRKPVYGYFNWIPAFAGMTELQTQTHRNIIHGKIESSVGRRLHLFTLLLVWTSLANANLT
jgi:hypothetical protein